MRWSTIAPAAVRCGTVSLVLGLGGCQPLTQADVRGDGGSSGANGEGTTSGPAPTTVAPTTGGDADGTSSSDGNPVQDEGSTSDGGSSSTSAPEDDDSSTGGTSGSTGGDPPGTTGGTTTGSTGRGEEESSSSGECSPSGAGNWANCPLAEDCGDPAAFCIGLDDVVGVDVDGICGFPCSDACDCPAEPNTGNAVVTCGDVGGIGSCYLSCEAGETCPDGTQCFASFACAYDNVIEVGDYEGCNSPNYTCQIGSLCVGNGANSTCLPQGCMNAGQCPTALGATVSCGDADSAGPDDCFIDCTGPLDCPDGWDCLQGFLCAQPNP